MHHLSPACGWGVNWRKRKSGPLNTISTSLSNQRCLVVQTCLDPISNKVVHIIIITLHVLLHPQCCFPFFNKTSSHIIKKSQRFGNWSVPPRTVHLFFPVLLYFVGCLKQIFSESGTLSRLIKKIIPRKQCTSAKHRLFFSFSFFPNQIPLKKIQNTRTQQQPQLQPFIHQRKEE